MADASEIARRLQRDGYAVIPGLSRQAVTAAQAELGALLDVAEWGSGFDLHYEQGIYPLRPDRDVMITAMWALDDFTADNGATRIVPGSHLRARRASPTRPRPPPRRCPPDRSCCSAAAFTTAPAPTPPLAARGRHRLRPALAAPLRGTHPQRQPYGRPPAPTAPPGTPRLQPAHPPPWLHQRPAPRDWLMSGQPSNRA